MVREKDSNLRLRGYGPGELPLLYPTMRHLTRRTGYLLTLDVFLLHRASLRLQRPEAVLPPFTVS